MNASVPGDPPPDGALFSVNTEYAGRVARLALRGELDLATIRLLEDELRVVWAREFRRIEIDLRELVFIGSTGISVLLEANARARNNGVTLTLVRGPAHIQRIFELTGIESQFAFRDASARPGERPLDIVG